MARMTDEDLWKWQNQTPQDVFEECRRARSEEARLLKETAEKDRQIAALADALDAIRDSRTHLGEHDPTKIAAAVRRLP